MSKVIRRGVFETNSSSSHSLSLGGDNGPGRDEYVELNDVAQRLAMALQSTCRTLGGRQIELPDDAATALQDYARIQRKQREGDDE